MDIAMIPSTIPENQIDKNISVGALKKFELTLKNHGGDYKFIFKRYRRRIAESRNIRHALKNPVNKKTGKPLNPNTVKQYRSRITSCQREMKDCKGAIQLLILHGYINAPQIRARWVRDFRAKRIRPANYTKGLRKQEKRFVEAYSGNPLTAARKAGFRGNFATVKRIGYEITEKLRVRKALKFKTEHKARVAGFLLINGDGQGTGECFNTKPEMSPTGEPIRLLSYLVDIKRRFQARNERIFNVARKARALDDPIVCMGVLSEYDRVKKAIDRLDYDGPIEEYRKVTKMIEEVERGLGLLRGNYRGF